MTVQLDKRPAAIRVVIPFVFRHWLQQPGRAAVVAAGLLGATAADLFMPIFSGRLVDALTLGASDPAARPGCCSQWRNTNGITTRIAAGRLSLRAVMASSGCAHANAGSI